MTKLSAYATLVFDCDGVVLDSNRIKTEAFRTTAMPWGTAAADAMVAHHVAHGGVSRYAKFAYFLSDIVPAHATAEGPGLQGLLSAYAQSVRQGLMECAVEPSLAKLRAATPGARWLVVSGGDQEELRELFTGRGIAHYFDGGIFGSPDTKDAILAREIANGNIHQTALFIGDSVYDYEAATRAGIDFIFVSGWTEVENWQKFVVSNQLVAIAAVGDLLMGEGSSEIARR